MKTKDFEDGVRYEKLREQTSLLTFMGWGCIILFVVFTVSSIIGKSFFDIWELVFLLIFGVALLCSGYYEKKKLKQYK